MNIQQTREKWLEKWSHLSLKEKQAVIIGSSVLMLFILYQCIWMPVLGSLANMRQRITASQKTLVWMQAADKTMQGSEIVQHKTISLVALLSEMQKQIKLAGLEPYLGELKQAVNESVEMHFQKVEFDKLVVFLMAMTREYPISITQMTVNAQDTPGVVNADLMVHQSSQAL
jgi:type II secretory pathway component PulM